ncbi:MAG: 2-hydroxyacyl-CoA dehydratase family protein [Desulfotomaculales bacterium]
MDSAFVDVTCSYIPTELIRAAGFTPRRWLPAAAGAGGGLPQSLCSYARACVTGSGAAAVFTTCCDGMRRCYDLRALRGDRVFILDLPRTAHDTAVAYFAGELQRLADWLADLGGRPVTATGLAEAMAPESRRQQSLLVMAAGLPAAEWYGLRLKGWAEPSTAAHMKQGASSEPPRDGPPVLLTGTCPPDSGFVAAVEESGLRPAGLDFCTTVRCSVELPAGRDHDPWLALARGYLAKPPCPRTVDRARRRAYLEQLLDRTGARGVVLYGFKFCDHTAYDLGLWRTVCRHRGLPLLYLEGEYGARVPGQFLTRLHAFSEALEA